MKTVETQQQFVQLRAQGVSFARIADQLKVSKPTLIKWSRKFQYEIQNLRAIELEALKEKWLSTHKDRVNHLGEQLRRIEAEIAKRDLATVPTARLHSLAEYFRRQILRETGQLCFTSPLDDIPDEEYHREVQDWTP